MILYCDLETFSGTPIRCGAARYAEDPEARILLWGYAVDDAPARVWQVGREPAPTDLVRAVSTVQCDPSARCVWHNGLAFDTVFIERVMPRFAMPVSRVIDTMILAYEHSLPGALGDLCAVLNLPVDKTKDKDGARLIRLFCAPRADGTKDWSTHPEDWQKFVNYCRLDVEAEREIYKRLPKVNATEDERRLMALDAEINRRGMLIDRELARGAVAACERNAEALRLRTAEITGGELDSTTRTAATIAYIERRWGVKLENLRKGEIAHMIEDPDLPEPMKELLRVRLGAAKASVKKFETLLDCACRDGRIRGTLQFRGASRTGRWAGRIFQPQNLPRPSHSEEEISRFIEAIKGGWLDLIEDDVPGAVADCLRGVIIAPEGKQLAVADYSNVEGRVLAWLAGETWKLRAFEAYDNGTGPDLYKLTYSRAFNVPVETVTKAQRQMGKVLELAMGYGGGPGAFVTFAVGYGIDLHDMARQVLPVVPGDVRDEAERAYEWAAKEPSRLVGLEREVWVACDSVKRLWRRANRQIVGFWNAVEQAASDSLVFGEGEAGKIKVEKRGSWLLFRLPSGRHLCYPGARSGGEDENCLFSYLGVHQQTRKWQRIRTYAGKVVENLTQATAADLLGNAFFEVEKAGFRIVTSIHDELVTEAPVDPQHTAEALEAAMTTKPEWAQGLPLAAAGYTSKRYKK